MTISGVVAAAGEGEGEQSGTGDDGDHTEALTEPVHEGQRCQLARGTMVSRRWRISTRTFCRLERWAVRM